VDRELYFDDPELAKAELSPDGAFITFIKPYNGVMNVWVKARTDAFSAARPLTADPRPVSIYLWSRDGKYVLYVQDKGGDENFHLYAVDPRASAGAGGVPEARDLTPGDKLRVTPIDLPRKTPDTVLIGLNDRDPQLHDVYRLTLSTGKRELVRLNKEGVAGWTADLDGTLRLATKMEETGGTQVLRVKGDALEPLASCTAEESCSVVRFHPDGKRVYYETNAGPEDLTRLVLLDVATGAQELVESDPEKQVDFGWADFSEATDELAATSYEGDRVRTYPRSPAFRRDWEALKKALPDGDLTFTSRTTDERFQLVTVQSDVDPGATYLYERGTAKATLLFRPRPKLPVDTLVSMQPVRITARDGVVLTAYLTLPRGTPGPGPAVLLPHGGPWSRDSWGYSGFAQFLANRGYAVLQVNFRGSTGFGKKFLNLGNGQWGTGTMQHDLTDARQWLIERGHAAPRKVAIMGGSYGGYATLAGVAFTPELYAAGVDIVGPSNIVTLLSSIPPYWTPIKKMFAVRVGDLEKPEDVARLQAQSPLNFAGSIMAPLLVIQGANDPRVKQAEADQIVVALREKRLPVEYLVAPDEGHGFRGRDNRLAMMVAVERFLAKHLGGRVQEGVGAEVAAKLSAITVDVASVKKPVRELAKAVPLAFDAKGLKPATFAYSVTGTVQGRPITGTSQITLAKAKTPAGAWTVTSVDKLPFGEAVEVTTLDGKTLFPVTRTLTQGPATVELAYGPGGAKGSMKAGPNTMPIDAKSESPLAADGSVLGLLAGRLPLAKGYAGRAPVLAAQTSQVVSQTLVVKGEEPVTVAGKPVDAWKVELTSDDGTSGTLWVEKAGARRMLRLTAILPQGVGTLTQELTK
jgi:dipeptidyl aminopeptidase/acylaminoacyl peptidase